MRKSPRGGAAKESGYLVVFDGGGGTASFFKARTDASGKLAGLPTATRTDYTLSGWYTAPSGGTKIDTNTIFTEDTVVYAQWLPDNCVVTMETKGEVSSGYHNAYIILNGTNITAVGDYTVKRGTVMTCCCGRGSQNGYFDGYIYLNGSIVARPDGYNETTYKHTVNTDCSVTWKSAYPTLEMYIATK